MNLYYYLFFIALILTILHKSSTDTNTEFVFPECGLLTPSHLSIGLVFFVKINNTSDENDYEVEITPDECCLQEEDNVDCDSLQIIGGCTDYIPKGESKTVKVIAPILNQYERKGSCAVFVDSKSNNGRNKRDTIKINFDSTSYKDKLNFLNNYKQCKHKDEDPFNDCKPVNCDIHYNGKKTYFNRKEKRCISVPLCVREEEYDYPSVIYNPQTNQCFEESIVNEDLEYIKTLNRDDGKKRKTKDILIINEFDPNITTYWNNDILIDNIETSSIGKKKQKDTEKDHHFYVTAKSITFGSCSESQKRNRLNFFLKEYFIDNKWTLLVLVLVIIVQCIMICTFIYCFSKSFSSCCKEKKVVRKFFNYRQDVSVTTPLINTSNIDTETTEYQYVTESSNNIDQKIKCYKACEKEKNNVKKSMSDDILSKLLNRRDWAKFKSQVKPEHENTEEAVRLNPENNQIVSKDEKGTTNNGTKVNFEDEKVNHNDFKKKTKLENVDTDTKNEKQKVQVVQANISSEKEIKCHSYSHYDTDVAEYRTDIATNVGIIKNGKSKKETSNSSEKGAQAYFSNDSIDDFLSERGMIYLAGENMSKYTFSSGSNDMKPTSSGSSKTSKNFVRNVLSLLNKRPKQGTSSDPGQNKDLDLELLHMSRVSVYSSTNESECSKNLKGKDSRTSF